MPVRCIPKKTAIMLGVSILMAPVAVTTVHSTLLARANSIIYDMSQYQGYITYAQARELKRECPFIILKAENGGLHTDPVFDHNARILDNIHMPYGVYDYSLYANSSQAHDEAKALLSRAPKAKFYINDCEENDAGSDLGNATYTWAKTIRRNTNRPAVLYSGAYFMSANIPAYARRAYNAIWVASYGLEPSTRFHYDLWQFSSNYYSRALGQALDASTFPDGNNKPLQFWIGGSGSTKPHGSKHGKRSKLIPLNAGTRKATKSAYAAAMAKFHHEQHKYHAMRKKANHYAKKANSEAQQIQALHNTIKHESMIISKNQATINDDNKKLAHDSAEISRLKGDGDRPGQAYRKKPSVPKTAHTASQKQRAKDADHKVQDASVMSNYYRDPSINFLMVTAKHGINIYNMDNKLIRHVRKGTVLYVDHFQLSHRHGHKITEAVGISSDGNGNLIEEHFSSNKHVVRRY